MPKLARQPNKRNLEEIRYGRLWADIELPKLMESRKQ
jgi:hypothetical protein